MQFPALLISMTVKQPSEKDKCDHHDKEEAEKCEHDSLQSGLKLWGDEAHPAAKDT